MIFCLYYFGDIDKRDLEDSSFCNIAAIPLEADCEQEIGLIRANDYDIEIDHKRRELSLRACEEIYR